MPTRRQVMAWLMEQDAATLAYYQRVMATTPIVYWTLGDVAGTAVIDEMALGNGVLGADTAAPTLGVTGIGDGRTAFGFDGGDYTNVYTAALNVAFTPGECTLMIWTQITSAPVWVDGASHYAMQLRTDANNRIVLSKTITNNTLRGFYVAGGTAKTLDYTSSGQLTWVNMCLTVSKAADEIKLFVNGAQAGITQTGLGTWVGALSATRCNIGIDIPVTTAPWIGNLAHAAVWSRVLAPSEVASLAAVNP